jgi:hypothetical protein
MDKQKILRKAFRKAKENGWNSYGYEYIVTSFDKDALPPVMIFDHAFAKAFFGYGNRDDKQYMEFVWPEELWHHCLKEMVVSSDPIKYLEQFLSV